ncbi:MAG: hypothetical protein FWH05_08825 [Oscillospiraceae bacterium]|nr:hypothetical protein [Oscillospiraceae bacterium]
MYQDIMSNFCPSCLNKRVNSEHTVEDIIMKALKAGETNNLMGGYLMLQGVIATLEEKGGCPTCTNVVKRVSTMLEQG